MLRGHRTKALELVSCAWSVGSGPLGKWRALWRQTKNVRARAGISKYSPRTLFPLKTKFGTLWFRDNVGDIRSLGNVLYRGAYRWKKVEEDGIILDVGANIGLAGVWFAHHNPAKPLWCFEPVPDNVALIRRNCWQARVIESALGEAEGTVTLRVDTDTVIASSIPNAWESVEKTFPVRTLDACAAEFGWGPVALLKIVTEGMEPQILRGGRGLLSRVARVAVETHGDDRHAEVLGILRKAGFAIEIESRDHATGMVFAVRQKSAQDAANDVAVNVG